MDEMRMNNADEIVRAAQEAIEHLQGCYEVMSAVAEVRKEEIKSQRKQIDQQTQTIWGIMHSVDKWLDGKELKGDEVHRASVMREKVLKIIESQAAEIKRQREMLSDSFQGHLLAELERKDARIAELEGITFWAQNRQLQADLARVTAERDAAVRDMREAIFNDRTSSCSFCAHANRDPNTAPYCLANFCANDEWMWRGVQTGEGETE